MKPVASLLAALALLAAPAPALAAGKSLAGDYHLEGVMETGSELALDTRGRFQWYLVYGALDLFAQGTWRQEDGAVVLTSEKDDDLPDPPFETLRLRIRDADLVPPDDHGAYVRAGLDAPVIREE